MTDRRPNPELIPVLSVWEPWATLIALGFKTVETRKGATTMRGHLAIHSARRRPQVGLRVGRWTVTESPAGMAMESSGPGVRICPLHLGHVLATVVIAGCVPVHRCSPPALDEARYGTLPEKGWDVAIPEHDDGDDTVLLRGDQWQLGDFTPERFAWLFDEVRRLERPIPYRGGQGLSRRIPAAEVGLAPRYRMPRVLP